MWSITATSCPIPSILFCILIALVIVLAEVFALTGLTAVAPETQILRTEEEGRRTDGRQFLLKQGADPIILEMENASHSSKLNNLYVEFFQGDQLLYEEAIDRMALKRFEISRERFPEIEKDGTYLVKIVNRSKKVPVSSVVSKEGLNWFVLSMVENFAHFEPLGLVLAMSLTNAATGNHPEINVFANWYFMSASVIFLSLLGTFVTVKFIMPRLGESNDAKTEEVKPLTSMEKKGLLIALTAILVVAGLWLLTILPVKGWLRNPDPNPDLIWRSNFFRGLIPSSSPSLRQGVLCTAR